MTALTLIVTPHGRLLLESGEDVPDLPSDLAHRLQEAFACGSGHGLLQLGAAEVGTPLPPVFGYWRELGARYVSAVCGREDLDTSPSPMTITPPPHGELERLAEAAPPMPGAEYVTPSVLEALWHELGTAFHSELAESKTTLEDFLRRRSPAWHVVGRVHFNLAENRLDAEAPFAFLATYTTRLSAHAKAQHLPLGRALTEYAGVANRSRLLSLLLPVRRATEQCPWLKSMVDSGEIFHPLRWTPAETFTTFVSV
jgi:non-specific serine/threonine protein kinase